MLFLLFPFCGAGQNTLPSLGMWREHLPYQVTLDLAAADTKIYAATPHSLFSVDLATKETARFSTVSGLSETGISTIAFDRVSQKLFVAYSNSNIDVLTSTSIRNIPALKRSTLSGNKNIYHIFPDGNRCYLSTGLGVVVLDADRYEVKDSWFIGNGGSYVKTNGFTKSATHFYAATDEGLKRTAITSPNPADFRAWQNLSGSAGLAATAAKAVVTTNNKTIVLQNDSLFVENGSAWSPLFANGWRIVSINASGNGLLVSQRNGNAAQIVVLTDAGLVQRTIASGSRFPAPQKAVAVGTDIWVADLSEGLVHISGNNVENYKLNSPQNIVLGEMAVRDGVFWATAGAVNSSWNYQYNPSGIFRYEDNFWSAYNLYSLPQLDSLLDFITLAIDPRDGSAWGGSFGGGLVHVKKLGQPVIYKQGSPISATIGDPGSYRVAGLAFDRDHNLWVANFGSPRQLHVLKTDQSWQSFTAPFALTENAAAQILVDNEGWKWIQSPLGNGLLVFDQGRFETAADDRWRLLKTGAGLGNLPSNEVRCLAKDKDGFIWVGTTNGVGVFQCGQDIFGAGCDAILPVVKEGAFANFLFRGQEVNSIAVDGANRKWIATASGVWLISADGDKVLANYTETNSPLPGNDVKKLAIDGQSGEIYIATAKGLISLRGNATEAEETKNKVLVFPNPVPPGYTGTIGIRGMPENSFVKITGADGRLVHQTRSLGGQAVWNGKDYNGRKAASGVYFVIATDNLKGEQVVAKIVMVQ
jgi:hypothetical protein